MGTWGTGPLDNDGAADLVYYFEKQPRANKMNFLHSHMTRRPKNRDYLEHSQHKWESLGLLLHCLEKCNFGEEYIFHGLTYITELQADREWLKEWNDTKDIQSSLKKIFSLLSNMKNQGGKHNV